jgi:hypothetical protein
MQKLKQQLSECTENVRIKGAEIIREAEEAKRLAEESMAYYELKIQELVCLMERQNDVLDLPQ